jgi:GxxExxY protein
VTTADLKHSNLTDKLINTYYSLYNELGYGFLESIYQKAFALMLKEQRIRFREQAPIRVTFHGMEMGEFLADLLVEGSVLVELKAVRALEQAHERQLLNYLRATNVEVGLLFNLVQSRSSGGSPSTMTEKAEQRVQPHLIHEPLKINPPR